jgi:hypothetical protein
MSVDSQKPLSNSRGVILAIFVVALAFCAFPPSASAKPKYHHFGQARTLAPYLQRHTSRGCGWLGYVVEPGKAVHPSEQGETPQSTGLGWASFEMNDRLIEWAGCSLRDTSTTLGIQRFDGSGLSLAKYRHRLETLILPEACQLFGSSGDTLVEAIWESGGSLWNVEPNSTTYEGIVPLPVKQRTALLNEITKLVGGDVVVVPC